ncbi:PAS domain-containing protein [Sneathiella chinensis]|uniref:Transcriptional regulator n=1 Tax=Sneathiella chinensis TaxID=349750 RepID=A0ABQ5U3N0_9PROT|nr:PAS domain-containing protein [Sneathiella chinensis]GLQ05096.1 transcriptional regulator [Sneathiella chinensis]
MATMVKAPLTGVERTFDPNELIVSKTDLTGKIVYGNRLFFQLAGYTEQECLGKQHNVVRHPDMPRAVFDLLWETIKAGREIFAYVVNRSSNGDHYWVFAHITPSLSSDGAINGYHSNRRTVNRSVLEQHIIPLYRKLREIEASADSPKAGLANSRKFLTDLLAEKGQSFNQFMFSLEQA